MPIFGTRLSRSSQRPLQRPLQRRNPPSYETFETFAAFGAASAPEVARAGPLTHEEYRLAAAWLDHLWNQAPSERNSRLMEYLLALVDEFEGAHTASSLPY